MSTNRHHVYKSTFSSTLCNKMSDSYIRFKGTVGYTLNFDTVNIRFDGIEHDWGWTGTMKVELWASANYNKGSSWTGWRMGEYQLESIKKGVSYTKCDVNVPRSSPPPGQYTMLMILQSYYPDQYFQRDIRVFDSKASTSRQTKFGAAEFSYSGKSLSLTAKDIRHNSGGTSGSIKLVLWASKNLPVNNGWTGYQLGETQLDSLGKGEMYTGVTRNVTLKRPPSGSYFVIMQLLTHEGNWVGKYHIAFPNVHNF